MKYKCLVSATKSCSPPLLTVNSVAVDPLSEILANASAQKKAADEIKIAKKKLQEFEKIYNMTTDIQVHNDIYSRIENLQAEIKSNKDKINNHYCLASVKCVKQFASTFNDMLVIVSQDDKAKIGLGVPAVS
ncbi:16530_t:CDS:2 [Cetraspora pellucida]|uniref:16530_t:CDS:1 n=1 Tax=Cetraspora pellucida TaxID=1433469 RepID=A0A9N9NUE2_9GLOM|nr:16530_t:CDS:2 [Cetraspora pellucida]